MISVNKKVALWSSLLALSYLFLFLSIVPNILIALSFFPILFSVYVTLRDLAKITEELTDRLVDYECLNLLAARSISLLDSRRNLLSLFDGIYKSPTHRSHALLRMRLAVGKVLQQKIFKFKILNDQEARISSPLTKLLFSLIEKLDFIDEHSLRELFTSLHNISSYIYLNVKKLKELIAAERLKYKVLQTASSMTLGFMIKILSIFTILSSPNASFSLITFTFFAALSIMLFIVFSSIIHLRHPSFKELAFCIFIFLAFIVLPPYGGA
ncbi:hypothetical protein DSO06_04375 [Candidatus Nezhaarchaeota archaeon WYZ-LMO8]|nr:MAG: hypothetical protein DSO06_04375 [Candidatus Nezhaarchaeota archaeon WYZ-LMO8]TDA36735.1 MAG: hypothetical protein DSO05_02525 [Candidatus Nezhaarchaeota archaeon WYZ-LMO7]